MDWLVTDARLGPVTFRDLTRAVSRRPRRAARRRHRALRHRPHARRGLRRDPAPPAAPLVRGRDRRAPSSASTPAARRLALLAAPRLLYLAVFGQWQSAMVTLASIAVAVPLGVAGGLALGIAACRHRRLERALAPMLDAMQTVPVFAYLLPILILFGFGPVSALIATVIYAMPPMVRDHAARAPRRRARDRRVRPHGRLHAAPAHLEGDAPGRPRAADGRRQPGHHALAQHGHHRLDDRRRAASATTCSPRSAASTSARASRPASPSSLLAIVLDRLSQAYACAPRAGTATGRLLAAAAAAALALWALALAVPASPTTPSAWRSRPRPSGPA